MESKTRNASLSSRNPIAQSIGVNATQIATLLSQKVFTLSAGIIVRLFILNARLTLTNLLVSLTETNALKNVTAK